MNKFLGGVAEQGLLCDQMICLNPALAPLVNVNSLTVNEIGIMVRAGR